MPSFSDFNGTSHQEGSQPMTFYSTPSLVCGIVMIIIAVIGIIGNAITAVVFSCKKKPKTSPSSLSNGSYVSINGTPSVQPSSSSHRLTSIAVLVTGLACVDAVLLSLSCPLFASSAFYACSPTLPLLNAVSYMTVYVYPLASVFQTASVWTLSIITVERYIAVSHPFVARAVFTPRRAMCALGAIALISLAYNAPRFWEYCIHRIEAADDPDVVLIIALQTLRNDANYMRIYGHWMYFVFIFAVPFAILVFFNGSVIRVVRLARFDRRSLSRHQTKEQGTALMMVSVAVVFVACNLLAFVLNALEVFGASGAHPVKLPSESSDNGTSAAVRNHSSTFYLLVDFNNLLVMTHCSANFFVYYNFSECFRKGFYRLMRRWSEYCCCCFRIGLAKAHSCSSVDAAGTHRNSMDSARRRPTVALFHRRRSSRGSYCSTQSWRNSIGGKTVVSASAYGWSRGDYPIRLKPNHVRILQNSVINGVRCSL